MTTLAEEIVLLAHDDKTGASKGFLHMDRGLAGAILMELMLAGRVSIHDRRVRVADASGIGNQLADDVLARIAADPVPRKPEYWINQTSSAMSIKVTTALVGSGVLRQERSRVWGFIPVNRFLPGTGGVKDEILRRLDIAAKQGYATDARTAVLAGILRTLYMDWVALPGYPVGEARAALKRLATGEWAESAVKSAIASSDAFLATVTSVAVIGVVTDP